MLVPLIYSVRKTEMPKKKFSSEVTVDVGKKGTKAKKEKVYGFDDLWAASTALATTTNGINFYYSFFLPCRFALGEGNCLCLLQNFELNLIFMWFCVVCVCNLWVSWIKLGTTNYLQIFFLVYFHPCTAPLVFKYKFDLYCFSLCWFYWRRKRRGEIVARTQSIKMNNRLHGQ